MLWLCEGILIFVCIYYRSAVTSHYVYSVLLVTLAEIKAHNTCHNMTVVTQTEDMEV